MRAWLALTALLVLSSCASTARITGNFPEYRAYRQTRVATTLEQRLGASDRYLRDYPQGDYRDEVRAWFGPAEKRYFKLSWNSLPRLRAYLDAMPHGPHAEAAADRITELDSRRVFAERREQRMMARAQSFEDRLARAAEQRRAFLQEIAALSRGVAATRSFGQPTSELDSELLLRFRVRQPPGRCEGDRCNKAVPFVFSVPEAQALAERKLELAIELTLDRGLVQRVSLSAPDLLLRVAEAAKVRAIPESPQARAEALGQGLEIVANAIAEALPEKGCSVEAVSPVVLERRCQGVRFQVLAGTEPGAPDRIVVQPDKR